MSSDRPAAKREWTSVASIAITIVTAGSAIIVRFGALEEAKANALKNLLDHEQRISAIERSNALLERIHNLEKSNVAIQSELTALREELQELRARRR